MYRVICPIFNHPYSAKERRDLLAQLSDAGVQEVILVFNRVLCNEAQLKAEQAMFLENKAFLEAAGLLVGAWLAPTIGYGSAHRFDFDASNHFTHIQSTTGAKATGAYCPLDEGFVAEFFKLLDIIAETGVKFILFEDDFTLTGGKLYDPGCCCERHLERLRTALGRNIEREEFHTALFRDGKNPVRDTWLQVMGDTLRDFIGKIEKHLHSAHPEIRLGLSANASSYDIEGVSMAELVRIAAGRHRPLIRTTGAPYWKHTGSLAENIEAARVQRAWCGNDIELLAEGDTYPRPRHWVSANDLESFDIILRADGCMDGILKYMMDYNSSTRYETGYTRRHARNQGHYKEIARRFTGKTVGLNLCEYPLTFAGRSFRELDRQCYGEGNFLPLASQWLTTDNSIPVAYGDPDSACLALGENARYIGDEILRRGVITDAAGARILMERGIDVGIRAMEPVIFPSVERFDAYDEETVTIPAPNSRFYRLELSEGAEMLSVFGCSGSGLGVNNGFAASTDTFPACYRYENPLGQRFVVYSFTAESVLTTSEWQPGLFRNYCRQRQLADGVQWLQGKPLPAICFGNPGLYILCKRDGDTLTVGLWNLSHDEAISPEIFLDREYTLADCYRCSGTLTGNVFHFHGDLMPYSFAFFTVK